jgi:hypothetical protein
MSQLLKLLTSAICAEILPLPNQQGGFACYPSKVTYSFNHRVT